MIGFVAPDAGYLERLQSDPEFLRAESERMLGTGSLSGTAKALAPLLGSSRTHTQATKAASDVLAAAFGPAASPFTGTKFAAAPPPPPAGPPAVVPPAAQPIPAPQQSAGVPWLLLGAGGLLLVLLLRKRSA